MLIVWQWMIKLHLTTFPVRDALFSNMGYPQTEVTEPRTLGLLVTWALLGNPQLCKGLEKAFSYLRRAPVLRCWTSVLASVHSAPATRREQRPARVGKRSLIIAHFES